MSKKLYIRDRYDSVLDKVHNAIELGLIELRLGNFKKLTKYSYRMIKARLMGYPSFVMIEPTNACNLHCPLCTAPPWMVERARKITSYEEGKLYIDNVKSMTPNVLFYLAGEPLLNKDLFKIVRYAEDNGLKTMFSTNATLFNRQRVQELLDSGLSRLIISFDGATKESYEKYRVNAKFDNVVSNIKMLCSEKKNQGKLKPVIELQFIVTKYNENEIPMIKQLAAEMGVDKLDIKALYLPEYIYGKDYVTSLAREFLPDKIRVKYKYDEHGHPELIERPTTCSVWKTPVIQTDGRVSMCCYDFQGKNTYGNVKENSFKAIWNSKRYSEDRKKMAVRGLSLCQDCSMG